MADISTLMRPLKILFILPVILLSLQGNGQRARLFSTDAELSNSLIGDIHQDHKGLIWIATEDGINKYDGSKITVYKEKDGILGNYVRVIFEDSEQHLFFGYFNGLQQYDRAFDTFKTIPLLFGNNISYPSHVLSMIERRDKTILIGTSGHGIYELLNTDSGYVAKQKPGYVPSRFISYFYEDDDENLWVATQDQGLIKISKNDQQQQYYDLKGLDNVSSICQDLSGNLYVSSLTSGLFKYNKQKDQFDCVSDPEFRNLSIKVLYPIKTGNILVGTDGEGMKLFDPEKEKYSNLNFNVSDFDFSKSKIHTILEDDKMNTWLGLYQKGVVLLPPRRNNFGYFGYQSVIYNVIGSNYIMSVFQDKKGIIWIGTDSDGLYGVTPEGKQVAHYSPSEKDKSVPSTITSIYEDSELNLWIGSYLNGLKILDRKTGIFREVSDDRINGSGQIQRIFSITEDDNKTLWVGTLMKGLYSINLQTNEIKQYRQDYNPDHPEDESNRLYNSWINCLLYSGDGTLYIGTTDGLSSFDLKTRTFTNMNQMYYQLWAQQVHTLHQDNLNNLWVGTSRGLMKIDKKEKRLTEFQVEDGLPNNIICGIESDQHNNVWISTNYGISKYEPKENTFLNYNFNDGLQGNEFSKRAVFKNQDGVFFFGGINGVTFFKPDDIKDNIKQLDIVISDFYIHDTPVHKGMKSGSYDIIDAPVMETDIFELSNEDNSFTIEFSVLEYINPKRISYLYSIDKDNWISLQKGTNTVTFNNLDPGHYTFRVKAKDFNIFSETKEFAVIIHPAWYFSGWAKVGYLIFTLLIILIISSQIKNRYEIRKRMREHLQTRQINEAKLEFFTNISHEIKTPLSLILNPLIKLIKSDKDDKRQIAYGVMRRNTERILRLVNQIMDLRKIDKGKIALKFSETDIIRFIQETTEIFTEQLHEKSIDFNILHPEKIPKVWIDPNFFDKVIQNLLSNAIKFTPENGKIDLRIEISPKQDGEHMIPQLSIICLDNGIGLEENETDKIFDRFYQASNNQNLTVGNGIGLHLTRSIIELHYGTIHAENNTKSSGARFVITLPLGNAHLKPEEIVEKVAEHSINIDAVPSVLFEHAEENSIKSKSKRKVLVVDDDKEIRHYISNELANEYHMHECVNGREALTYVLAENPDLIISDVKMPEMDGITLCKKVKQNVNINHIPIILLTAKSEDKDKLEGLGYGADAYMSKPFNMEILRKTAENIIKNRELLKNTFSGSQLQSDKVKNIELKSSDEKLLQRVMDVVNSNIDNPNLNGEFLATEIGISRVHLYRKLKELTNQSVRDLIRNIRLRQAAEILMTKNINISEVAYATGFSNPSKFSTSFKELYGVAPKDYIKKMKDNV